MADERRDDDLDATEQHQPVSGADETAILGGDESGRAEDSGAEGGVEGGGDETSVLPPSPESPRWTARAGVPPPGTPRTLPSDATPTEEWQAQQERSSWWLPAVLGLVALLLLGALGAGIYLIMQSLDDGPAPAPTTTPSPTASPTTAPPTTGPPSPTAAPTTAPAQVAIPPVVGLTRLQAEQRLVDAGLSAVIETRVQEGATPGRVIQVVPAEGTLVAPGSQVTLVVAAQPPPTSAPPTGEPTTTPPA